MTAVERIWRAAGKSLAEADRRQLASQTRHIPQDMQRLAAFWLFVEARVAEWRKRAFRDVPASLMADAFRVLNAPPNDSEPEAEFVEQLIAKADLPSLLVGAELLAFAADRAHAMAQDVRPGSPFVVQFQTPLGVVRLAGGANDIHPNQLGYLLVVDSGGDDQYRSGGGTLSPHQPVSLLMDLRGDDRYVEAPTLEATAIADFAARKSSTRRPCFGGGVLGYGVHVDLSGNDVYRSLGNSQGSGIFGAGLLVDYSGSDRYDCHNQGQGSALFGVGVLSDVQGSDEYRCFLASQGYGGTLGCGLLADFASDNDLYEANDRALDFP